MIIILIIDQISNDVLLGAHRRSLWVPVVLFFYFMTARNHLQRITRCETFASLLNSVLPNHFIC